jgi:hypothetical protein
MLKKFLFTEDSPQHVLDLDTDEQAFGPTYGNRRANGRQFREAWTRRDRRIANASSNAVDACNIAGCG